MYHKQLCRLQPTTSYHTVLGFPILARVPAQNFSKFDFIHVTFCVCSFRMDLLVQIDNLFDTRPDWNSQGYRVTVSFIFYLVADGPLCRHRIRAKRVFFDNLIHFNFIIIRCIFFLITLISIGFLSRVSWLHMFMENIDVAVCASLPWGGDMARICRGRLSISNLQGHRVYCIAFHHEPRPDQLHNSISSHRWQSSPISGMLQ